jgi:hypothetical protein
MPWAIAGGAVAAAGSIGAGILGSNASKSAASQAQQAQQATLGWIQNVYSGTSGNLAPFIGTGQQAQAALAGFYGLPGGNPGGATQGFTNFQQTPFYQFPLQQANLATNRALAASGLTNSGAALRDVSQLNSGYASQGLGQYLSGLGSLASGGQSAAAQLGSIGVGTGAQIGQANTNIGNAGALGTIGGANSLTQGIGGALGSLTNPQALAAYQTLYNGLGSSSYTAGGALGPTGGYAPGSIEGQINAGTA